MKTFVDTDVLLYAYDRQEPERGALARAELARLWSDREGLLSTQILQEFYVNVTRKIRTPLTRPRARAVVKRYAHWPVHQITSDDILEASEFEQRHSLSFWDALIVVSAARVGAERLLTEDLQHGRTIAGVRIEDPFIGLRAR